MSNNSKETIVCNSITIVNNEGKPCITLSANEEGGYIRLSDFEDGKRSGIVIGFIDNDSKDPVISFYRDGELKLGIGILLESGILQIRGMDGKAKHLIYVDGTMGKILSGNDVFESEEESDD